MHIHQAYIVMLHYEKMCLHVYECVNNICNAVSNKNPQPSKIVAVYIYIYVYILFIYIHIQVCVMCVSERDIPQNEVDNSFLIRVLDFYDNSY